jgi:hypothetical protein
MLGEHIRALKGGRWNHAIDCGDETVIHLADEGARRAVRRSYRPEFIAAAETVEVVTHRQRTFPADEVVARAYSRIADPALAAMFTDSESFAYWCTTGRPSGPGEEPARIAASPPLAEAPSPRRSPARAARNPRAKRAATSRPHEGRRAKAKRPPRAAAGPRAKAKAKARPARRAAAPRAGTKRRTPNRRRRTTKPRR